jgi:copper chaperone NosL
MKTAALLMLAALALAGCKDDTASVKPAPVEMTADALGHYCQMYVADHAGPKAQIMETGMDQPIWFVQVRDAVTYLRGKERQGAIRAIYVSDMGRAKSWSEPGRANWIDAEKALFVIDSRRAGGMDMPEAIPFGEQAAAETFVKEEGGRIVTLAEIPDAYVAPMEMDPGPVASEAEAPAKPAGQGADHGSGAHHTMSN